ncbi:ribonuclease III [Neurospora crassa]|nr:ribonuclease III [Neurospora crassa]
MSLVLTGAEGACDRRAAGGGRAAPACPPHFPPRDHRLTTCPSDFPHSILSLAGPPDGAHLRNLGPSTSTPGCRADHHPSNISPMKRIATPSLTSRLLVAARSGVSPATAAIRSRSAISVRSQSTAALAQHDASHDLNNDRFPPLEPLPPAAESLPSPLPERALTSAKLAALHARLNLSPKIPLQTLARTLVDASADENPQFNNANLAFVGQTLINYHIAEWLLCKYPRLPQGILFSAMKAYAGPKPLLQIARSWGVDTAAVPGGEVDPGLLQFDALKPGVAITNFGYKRTELAYLEKFKWRRGMASRVVLDDDFGDVVRSDPKVAADLEKAMEEQDQDKTPDEEEAEMVANEQDQDVSYDRYGNPDTRAAAERAHAYFVRAVVGAIYAHCGREAAKAFVKAHIMSRTLDIAKLFEFKYPTRELAALCAREDFEPPVARLLSETGRQSRTPVFVVGIYSGSDKLGEGAASSLDHARFKAAMNALKAWYLYSPGENPRVPSDMLEEGAKPWTPAYIDMGEVISR